MLSAQTPPGVPVQMVVTAEPHHGKEIPAIQQPDVTVMLGKERAIVTSWIPAQGSQAALQLFIVLDDSSSASTLGPQLEDLRRFILAQPATTAIAVGYMRNGTVTNAQTFTTDHAQAAKALRLPLGMPGVNASPYFSVMDLAKHWAPFNGRREILMISDGIDRYYGLGPDNPYVDEAVRTMQRAGVVVSSIYAGGAGHYGHTFYQITWAQNYLSQLADQTGGEAYFEGFNTPVAFAPYLQQFADRLQHQYVLTFYAPPRYKGGFERVRLTTETPHVDLVAAKNVYAPGEE